MSWKRSYTRGAPRPPRCARRERERKREMKLILSISGSSPAPLFSRSFLAGLCIRTPSFRVSLDTCVRAVDAAFSHAPRHCHSSRPALDHDGSNTFSKETRVYLVVSSRTRTSNSSTTRQPFFFEEPTRTNSPASVQAAIAQRRELMIVSSPQQMSLRQDRCRQHRRARPCWENTSTADSYARMAILNLTLRQIWKRQET